MKHSVINHRIGNLLGSTGSAAGYFLMIFGIIATFLYNWTGSVLIIMGMFMAFTYEGTEIDLQLKRIKNYTSLFGLIKTGHWYPLGHFKRFSIYKSKRSYTTYSRANVPLTLKNSDIRLLLLDETGSLKVTVNKYNSFEAAKKEKDELIKKLDLTELKEWVR
jgi:hypothetical protein